MNDMKEFTIVTTVQITEIIRANGVGIKSDKEYEMDLKKELDCDDVQVLKTQVFINDQN